MMYKILPMPGCDWAIASGVVDFSSRGLGAH